MSVGPDETRRIHLAFRLWRQLMQKISDSTNTANADGEYTEGNPGSGVPSTLIKASWLNTIQRELVNVIRGAGITLKPSDDGQLLKAINGLADKATDLRVQSSPTDNAPGKILTVGAFGLGAGGGGPILALDQSFVPGFYRYKSLDPGAPPGTADAGGSVLVNSGGGNAVQQLIMTTPGPTSNPYVGVRSFNPVTGVPGSWVSMYHSGNLGGATTAVQGLVKIATNAQVNAGTDDTTAVTPLKLANSIQTSATDTGSGKLMRVGAFGLGSTDGGPLETLSTAYRSGFYRYAASDPSAPASGGSAGSVIVSSLGGNYFQQLAITVPATTSNPLMALRAFDGVGNPGPWVTFVHTGNIDPWLMQPIGAVVAIRDDLVGASVPSTSSTYRYIKLTASDPYNNGALIGESVSGSYPLVIATAVISLAAGSPMNGQTIQLINTERRILRAGLSGAVEQDTLQGHFHSEKVGAPGTVGNTADTLLSFAGGLSAAGAYNLRLTTASATKNTSTIAESISDPSMGTVRVSSETRPKTLGVTYYMRIK
jgi:hypothetical protein